MSERLKVLVSAYACEPGKGSEPEVGWQWVLHLAEHHDIHVLTRANNRQGIESALAETAASSRKPFFHYHDLPSLLPLKQRLPLTSTYYIFWQKTARAVAKNLHAELGFDLFHHLTFASCRYPTALWDPGMPNIWGPVGGLESVPACLLPWRRPVELLSELSRNLSNLLMVMPPFNSLDMRASSSSLVIAANNETREALPQSGVRVEQFPTIGLETKHIAERPPEIRKGPIRLMAAGRLVYLKGTELLIRAFARAKIEGSLTIYGDGPMRSELESLAARLGIAEKVIFRGAVPRDTLLEAYRHHDVFLFTGLHDSGAFVVIEAMAAGLPVICLESGGPAASVAPGCGLKIPLDQPARAVAEIAHSIRLYDANRRICRVHGTNSWQRARDEFTWQAKARKMSTLYEDVVCKAKR